MAGVSRAAWREYLQQGTPTCREFKDRLVIKKSDRLASPVLDRAYLDGQDELSMLRMHLIAPEVKGETGGTTGDTDTTTPPVVWEPFEEKWSLVCKDLDDGSAPHEGLGIATRLAKSLEERERKDFTSFQATAYIANQRKIKVVDLTDAEVNNPFDLVDGRERAPSSNCGTKSAHSRLTSMASTRSSTKQTPSKQRRGALRSAARHKAASSVGGDDMDDGGDNMEVDEPVLPVPALPELPLPEGAIKLGDITAKVLNAEQQAELMTRVEAVCRQFMMEVVPTTPTATSYSGLGVGSKEELGAMPTPTTPTGGAAPTTSGSDASFIPPPPPRTPLPPPPPRSPLPPMTPTAPTAAVFDMEAAGRKLGTKLGLLMAVWAPCPLCAKIMTAEHLTSPFHRGKVGEALGLDMILGCIPMDARNGIRVMCPLVCRAFYPSEANPMTTESFRRQWGLDFPGSMVEYTKKVLEHKGVTFGSGRTKYFLADTVALEPGVVDYDGTGKYPEEASFVPWQAVDGPSKTERLIDPSDERKLADPSKGYWPVVRVQSRWCDQVQPGTRTRTVIICVYQLLWESPKGWHVWRAATAGW